jgi:acyl carrier protein
MSIREIVYDQVRRVAEQQRKTLPLIADDVRILESGLDSLGVAVLIANLDDEFNVNAFDDDDAAIPVTYGDLVQVYQRATGHAEV